MKNSTGSAQTYAGLLASIKMRIQTAQVRAAIAVNSELVLRYWGDTEGDSGAARG